MVEEVLPSKGAKRFDELREVSEPEGAATGDGRRPSEVEVNPAAVADAAAGFFDDCLFALVDERVGRDGIVDRITIRRSTN